MPPPQALGAADRLLSFYGNELLARSGTLASVKSFGSQASAAASMAAGTATEGRPSSRGRPDGNDVVIDPYDLNSSDLESSSQSGFDSDGGRQEMSEPGDDTDWTASGYGDSDDLDDPGRVDDDSPGVPLSRQLRGGNPVAPGGRSRASSVIGGRSRASSVVGGDAMSVRSMGARALAASNSMRSRVSMAATSGGGGRGSISNFASFKSRASTVAGSKGRGAGRDLISFKRRASGMGAAAVAAAVAAGGSSFKSRASTVRPGAGAAAAGRDVSALSFKSRASTVPGAQLKGSIWTRALSNEASDAIQRRGGALGTPPMSVCSSRHTVQRGGTATADPKNRLSGKHVRRRLLRRRGWDFDITPGEIDFHLGRQLPDVLTRPQPTVNSEDEEEGENGSSDGDDDDGSLSAGGDEPPPGPALDAIKSYAKERAPEVLWSERLRSAKLAARTTGQAVTVRGRLDRKRRRDLARRIQKWDNREWFASRKRTPPAPPLHPAVVRVIEQWFALVDDDGSGTLDHSELLAALRASNVPVSPDNINEMIQLMDLDGDGVINWKEFETFFMYEFAAGKNLLSGEYVLPSGVALPFGVMIAKLKRNKLLSDLTEGGQARAKWTQVAENPMELEDELGMMAAVEMAMEEMRNPALARQRNRAAKALNRLPPHLRTKSMGRHLERHPEITEKLLRASSIAPFLLNTMKRCASSTSQVMARLASAGSQGSANSSAAPSVASLSVASSGPGSGNKGRGRNVDLNVAAALAAGLEWPVNGANFYNRRARTILRSVCQRPAEALLRNQNAKHEAVAAKAAAGAAAPAAPVAAEDDDDASPRKEAGKAALAADSGPANARPSFLRKASSRRNPSMRNSMKMMSRGRSRRRDSDDDEDGSDGGRPRRRSDSSDEVLPWLVNAKRREEEERVQLRAQLQGGGKGGPGSNDSGSSDDDNDDDDDGGSDSEVEDSGGAGGAGEDEEDVWVSPMLRTWLKQEHKLHRKRRSSGHRSLLGPGPELDPETETSEAAEGRRGRAAGAYLAPKASDGNGGDVAPRVSGTGSGNDSDANGGGDGGAAAAPLPRMTPRSRRGSGTGSLARRLLERSVQLPPELAALRSPIPGEVPSEHTSESGFLSVAGEVVAAAAAEASPALTPVTSRSLQMPPSALTIEASWGASMDTPTGGAGAVGGQSLEMVWSGATPGTAPVEGKPRKPRRRMRFEDEQDVAEQTDATTDAEKAPTEPGPGGLAAEASTQSLATALSGNDGSVSPAGPFLQLRALVPQQSLPYSEGRTASAAGEASGAERLTEDGDGSGGGVGGGGRRRSSSGHVPGGRPSFMRSSLLPGSAPSADQSAFVSPRGSAPASDTGMAPLPSGPDGNGASVISGMRSPRGGSRPRLSMFGPQELPSGMVRHWPAVSGGGAPTPLLRGSTAQATHGASSTLDGTSIGDGLYGNSDAESLDAEEARELMAAMTLDMRKNETLYDIHHGHQLERPSTSQFRAALAKIRTAASALLQSHSLPPHPEYTGAAAAAAAAQSVAFAGVHPRPPSATAGHSFLTARPAGALVSQQGPISRNHSGCGGPSSNGTDPGAGGSAAHRSDNGRGRGNRAIKQVATRSRSLLISGVRMRASVSSVVGSPAPRGGGGAAAAARRRRPSSPSSRPAGPQRPSMRPLSQTSVGFSHTPGLLGSSSEEVVGGGSGCVTAQPSVEQSYTSVAAVVAAGADPAGPPAVAAQPAEEMAAAAGSRVLDAGILAAAIDTARAVSRSRPPSRCKSPPSKTPVISRGNSPVRPRPSSATTAPPPPLVSLPSQSSQSSQGPLVSIMSAPPLGEVRGLDDSSSGGAAAAATIAAAVAAPAAAGRKVRGRVSPRGASPVPQPQLSEAWDAHVASMLQRRTAAEMAAVQRHCMAGKGGHSPREGGVAPVRPMSPDAAGAPRRGGTTADGAASARGQLPTAAAAGSISWRSGGGRSIPTHISGASTGTGDGVAAATAVAPSASAALVDPLLGPVGTSLPDFVPVPGAMPRLQSRYAPKRPPVASGPESASAAVAVGSGSSHDGMGTAAVASSCGDAAGESSARPHPTSGDDAQPAVAPVDGEPSAASGDAREPANPGAGADDVGSVVGGAGSGSQGPSGQSPRSDSAIVEAASSAEGPYSGGERMRLSEPPGVPHHPDKQLATSPRPPSAAIPTTDATATVSVASTRLASAPGPLAAAAAAAAVPALANAVGTASPRVDESLEPPPVWEESEASVAATSVAPDVKSPRHMRMLTISTEGSESPSRATSSDWWDERHLAASSLPQRAAGSTAQAYLPSHDFSKLTVLAERDGEDAGETAAELHGGAGGGGRPPPLSVDEALLMSGFGKPQTPTLARIERGTSRVALEGLSRHQLGPGAEPLEPPEAPAAAPVAPPPMAHAANPYTGGAAGFVLPAPSRLKITVPNLQLPSHSHHANVQAPPAPPPLGAQPPPHLHLAALQKPLPPSSPTVGPPSPKSLAAVRGSASGTGSGAQGSDAAGGGAAGVGRHGNGATTAAPTPAGAAAAPSPTLASPTRGASVLSGRSRATLQPLALVPQAPSSTAVSAATTASGEHIDGAPLTAPISPAITSPLPPVQAGKSPTHFPVIHQTQSLPHYHPHHHNPNLVYQQQPQQSYQQSPVSPGVGGGSGNVSVSGQAISAAPRVPPLALLQLPPLREPASPQRAESPRTAPPLSAPLLKNAGGDHLIDGIGGPLQPTRRRSVVVESLPALPMRVHSQGNLALQLLHQNTRGPGCAPAAGPGGAGGGSDNSHLVRGGPFRAYSSGSSSVGPGVYAAGSGVAGQLRDHASSPQRLPVHQRKAAWDADSSGASALHAGGAGSAAAAAAAAFAPAPPAAPLVAPVVSSLSDLPDIVSLLLSEPRPAVRTGPTRVRKMDY